MLTAQTADLQYPDPPRRMPVTLVGRSWLMELDPVSGARLGYSVFGTSMAMGPSTMTTCVGIGTAAATTSRCQSAAKQFDEPPRRRAWWKMPTWSRYISGSSGQYLGHAGRGAADLGGASPGCNGSRGGDGAWIFLLELMIAVAVMGDSDPDCLPQLQQLHGVGQGRG